MADTVTFLQNGYAGEVLEDLLTYTAQGNDTYREGLIHIKSGIQHKYTLPAIRLGDIIQDNVPTPQSSHGAKGENGENEYQFTERHLEPAEFMVTSNLIRVTSRRTGNSPSRRATSSSASSIPSCRPPCCAS